MDYSDYQQLSVTRNGPILTVSLNNPPMNPVSGARHRELSTIFADINRDDETRVVILTGAGEVFSAGGDLKALAHRLETRDFDTWPETMEEACNIIYGQMNCKKPIIGRINGDCIGLGASLAMFCDITVMVEDARIGDPHVKIGLTAGDGGALMWPQQIGFARAKEYLLTGDNLPATHAAEIGLINHAVPRAELDAKVAEIAEKIARLPAPGVQTTKVAINKVLQRQFDGLVEAILGLETWAFLSPDHRETVLAIRDRMERKKSAQG
ncbi:hypothetical protein HKCCE2091_03725 [Rhodobacterales bacterium HKCCE2091]|nr:hypothetical protein [Rhodobacterales bacterium HKCCE2091]